MTDIVLSLSNVRPAGGGLEHLFPEKNPRWRFAQLRNPAAKATVASGEGALLLAAAPLGPRIGAAAQGPVATWVVLTNPATGKETEYNAWYDGRHVADTLAIPGFVSAQRYRVTAATGPDDARWAYLALYEMELGRAAEALAEAAARAGGPKMPNPGMLAPGTAALPFRPIG
jgi:hypothetical protein